MLYRPFDTPNLSSLVVINIHSIQLLLFCFTGMKPTCSLLGLVTVMVVAKAAVMHLTHPSHY
jgi:hypothetical protein